ncbi:hypothetical protein GCM10022631_15180 [Deinococcus rubellus]|uniref:hypothetical protein n=1 Tax=Deinococcus rubellus TaxID=1889240 RepID=UPI0031E8CAAA
MRGPQTPVSVLLLSGMTLGQATVHGEGLRAAVEELIRVHGPLTISVGVSNRTSRNTVASLLHHAVQALYPAKKSGKNRGVMQGG